MDRIDIREVLNKGEYPETLDGAVLKVHLIGDGTRPVGTGFVNYKVTAGGVGEYEVVEQVVGDDGQAHDANKPIIISDGSKVFFNIRTGDPYNPSIEVTKDYTIIEEGVLKAFVAYTRDRFDLLGTQNDIIITGTFADVVPEPEEEVP